MDRHVTYVDKHQDKGSIPVTLLHLRLYIHLCLYIELCSSQSFEAQKSLDRLLLPPLHKWIPQELKKHNLHQGTQLLQRRPRSSDAVPVPRREARKVSLKDVLLRFVVVGYVKLAAYNEWRLIRRGMDDKTIIYGWCEYNIVLLQWIVNLM
uniref:Uncharacterized protein LOC105036053 n=1 Tax=Elaeis guineensis var. tenera TaxID=51953 RepID=A0A6I9QL27_ELAGV|nr:uncharacterized protein LOC105036053 [Elaeis guineensis]